MKITYSQKILFLAVTSLIIVLILNIVFVSLLLNKIESINNKVRQWDISSQERLREITLGESITSTESERAQLQRYFIGPGNAETVTFTKYLEDLAKTSRVTEQKTLTEDLLGELGSANNVLALKYRFNVSGSWSDIYNFLLAIENLPKAVLLNSVSLNLGGEALSVKQIKTNNKTWSADLDFSVLKLK